MADGIRMKRPVHPGQFVKAEIIAPLGLSVTAAAAALGVTRPALFLNGRASLSPEMAIRVEKAFGVAMATLMRMQTSFDIAAAERRAPQIKVRRYAPDRGGRRAPLPG
ncbi:MAG: HigA family addiction module antidote protein [Alphaproteobacteria bacterium]|nr:HigA family addiction module antidote protein [Alphaproteobacteria bacterium]